MTPNVRDHAVSALQVSILQKPAVLVEEVVVRYNGRTGMVTT